MKVSVRRRVGKCKAAIRHANPYIRTLYTFNCLSLVGGMIYGMYYGVFLYKHTFSLTVLAIDGLLGGIGLWLGYLVGVYLIRRKGYGWCIRIAFILWAVIAFVTAFITNHIAEWFMIIAVIKALPAGMYAAVGETIMLRDVATDSRSNFLQLNLALEFFASIMLPTAVGALISATAGYTWAFICAGIVYLLSFLIHCSLPKPKLTLRMAGMAGLFKKPLYPYHALNRTVAAGCNQLNAFAIMIVPFLLLQDELSIGVMASVSALIAAIVSIGMRRLRKARAQVALGFGAHAGKALVGALFVSFWTAPLLALWQVVGKVLTPLHDPLQQSKDYENDNLILGKRAPEDALQINVMNNTLKLVGTTIAFGSFIMITKADATQQRAVLEVLLVSYALWRMVNLAITLHINYLASQHSSGYVVRLRTVWAHKIRFQSYALYLRMQSRLINSGTPA